MDFEIIKKLWKTSYNNINFLSDQFDPKCHYMVIIAEIRANEHLSCGPATYKINHFCDLNGDR